MTVPDYQSLMPPVPSNSTNEEVRFGDVVDRLTAPALFQLSNTTTRPDRLIYWAVRAKASRIRQPVANTGPMCRAGSSNTPPSSSLVAVAGGEAALAAALNHMKRKGWLLPNRDTGAVTRQKRFDGTTQKLRFVYFRRAFLGQITADRR